MKSVTIKDNQYIISFDGSDFSSSLAIVKTLEDRTFIKERRYWTAPINESNFTILKNNRFNPPVISGEKEVIYPKIDTSKLKNFYEYQIEGVQFLESVKGIGMVLDEMGCIDGDMIVTMNRRKNSKKYTLKKAYNLFHNNKNNYDTFIRGLNGNRFGLLKVKNIICKGNKEVYEVRTENNKILNATFDHKLRTEKKWIPISKLKIGDKIIVNGEVKCKRCNSIENVVTSKYAKFTGYCRKCIYTELRNQWGYESHRRIEKDGYVYLRGKKYRGFHRKSTSGILEHVYLMEKHLGREINLKEEEIHHINGIRSDNRLENLKVVSKSQHSKEHQIENNFKDFIHKSGSEVIMIPKYEKIISIKYIGYKEVYDVVIDGKYHNFIANGILVHNCGKSAQSIGYGIIHSEIRPILVICPASVKLNWSLEIQKWANEDSYILYGEKPTPIVPRNYNWYIINYDILAYGIYETKNKKKKLVDIKGWVDRFKELNIQGIIIDECQTLSGTTIRTKAIQKIKKILQLKMIIPLSGTPMRNRPADFFNILNLLKPDLFPNRWKYLWRYAGAKHNGFGWEFKGASNIEELHNKIKPFMIRRTKEEVLKELPAKQKIIVPMELNELELKAYKEADRDFIQWVKEYIQHKKQDSLQGQIEKLKQLAYIAKRNSIIQWIKDILSSENKLVLFTYHRKALEDIYSQFKNISVILDGGTSTKDRQEAIDKFQKDNKVKLFIGQIQAAGVGITLTAASICAFVEFGYSPIDHDQAESRTHRIGQKADSVIAYYLIAKGTIEDDMMDMISNKYKVISEVIDGKDKGDFFDSNFSNGILKNYVKKLEKGI